jgi:hypothetical protein
MPVAVISLMLAGALLWVLGRAVRALARAAIGILGAVLWLELGIGLIVLFLITTLIRV